VAEPVVQLPTVEILVAKSDIGLGQPVKPEDLQWQTWPASAGNNLVNRASRAEAIKEIAGSIARAPFIAGEPIREQKLVKANGSGFMAAILPTGMRAISTEISPETGAGGFILPNDRVDVILSKREKNPDGKGADVVQSEIILSNIRVLAIDQAPKEKEGVNSLVGRTGHARTEARAGRDAGARAPERHAGAGAAQHHRCQRGGRRPAEDQIQKRSESVNVVRYGVANQTTAQK
jgi:pilus assembly protein CpaB